MSLNLNQPGYQPIATRLPQALTASQNFNPSQLVGLVSASGDVSPLNTSTVTGLAYAVGVLDPSVGSAIFESISGEEVPVLAGSFTLANGTSGNAFAAADVGSVAYSADGVTANKTSSSNPTNATTGLPSGTATGILIGIVTEFISSTQVVVTVIPELNAMLSNSGSFTGTLAIAHGGTAATTAAGARTALGTATAGSNTAGTAPAFTGAAPTAALTAKISGATIGWSTNVGTISAGGAVVAAHALAGGFITDGTLTALILDNSALTATTGTITTSAPAPTGTTVTAYGVPTPVGAVASHVHAQV